VGYAKTVPGNSDIGRIDLRRCSETQEQEETKYLFHTEK
jgi:hypothetical protein